jgi:hypothetical protein
MTDSDMVAFQASDEQSKFTDYFGVGYAHPVEDIEQDWTGSFQQLGQEVRFVVYRFLDTGDAQGKDYTFVLDEAFTVGYAY